VAVRKTLAGKIRDALKKIETEEFCVEGFDIAQFDIIACDTIERVLKEWKRSKGWFEF